MRSIQPEEFLTTQTVSTVCAVKNRATRWHCTKSWKVPGSIPDGVIDICYWRNHALWAWVRLGL